MTMMFLLVIMGATDRRAPQGMVPLAIGLCLTLIHLISIPVTNTSVNPARSTGVAVFVGDRALAQLRLLWVAPIAGAILAAALYRFIGNSKGEQRLRLTFAFKSRPMSLVRFVVWGYAWPLEWRVRPT